MASPMLRNFFQVHLSPSLRQHAKPLDRRFLFWRPLLARSQVVGDLLAMEICVAPRVRQIVQQLFGGWLCTGLEIGLEANEKIWTAWRD